MTIRLGVEAWGLSGDLRNTGIGQYSASLLCSIAAYSSEFSVVAYAGPGEPRPDWLPEPITWRPVGRHLPAKLTALASRTVSLPMAVRADKLDLFHAPAVHMRPFFPPVPRLACPLVVTLHDVLIRSYYDINTLPVRQRAFYRWNIRRAVNANVVITVSDAARREIIRETRINPDRIVAIHNAVDFHPNRDRQLLDSLGIAWPYVLYAGSYEPRKNLPGALRAFARLLRSGSDHHLVALVERSSGHVHAATREVGTLGLQDRVHLVHSLSDKDLRSLYTHASVLFFPSFAEGFGYPPVQAAACGVPVVASDLEVLHETMGDAAVFVDPHDDAAMAAALRMVLTDPNRRAVLNAAGMQRVGRYESGRWTVQHTDIYRRVTRRRISRLSVNPTGHHLRGRSL